MLAFLRCPGEDRSRGAPSTGPVSPGAGVVRPRPRPRDRSSIRPGHDAGAASIHRIRLGPAGRRDVLHARAADGHGGPSHRTAVVVVLGVRPHGRGHRGHRDAERRFRATSGSERLDVVGVLGRHLGIRHRAGMGSWPSRARAPSGVGSLPSRDRPPGNACWCLEGAYLRVLFRECRSSPRSRWPCQCRCHRCMCHDPCLRRVDRLPDHRSICHCRPLR
jgi:hypothetical protein